MYPKHFPLASHNSLSSVLVQVWHCSAYCCLKRDENSVCTSASFYSCPLVKHRGRRNQIASIQCSTSDLLNCIYLFINFMNIFKQKKKEEKLPRVWPIQLSFFIKVIFFPGKCYLSFFYEFRDPKEYTIKLWVPVCFFFQHSLTYRLGYKKKQKTCILKNACMILNTRNVKMKTSLQSYSWASLLLIIF